MQLLGLEILRVHPAISWLRQRRSPQVRDHWVGCGGSPWINSGQWWVDSECWWSKVFVSSSESLFGFCLQIWMDYIYMYQYSCLSVCTLHWSWNHLTTGDSWLKTMICSVRPIHNGALNTEDRVKLKYGAVHKWSFLNYQLEGVTPLMETPRWWCTVLWPAEKFGSTSTQLMDSPGPSR